VGDVQVMKVVAVITWKQYKIWTWLLPNGGLIVNHVTYRMVPLPMILSYPEGHFSDLMSSEMTCIRKCGTYWLSSACG